MSKGRWVGRWLFPAFAMFVLVPATAPAAPPNEVSSIGAGIEGPIVDGVVDDAPLGRRRAVHRLRPAVAGGRRGGERAHRSAAAALRNDALRRGDRVRQRTRRDSGLREPTRRRSEPVGLGPDHLRHVQRQPERVSLRDQPPRASSTTARLRARGPPVATTRWPGNGDPSAEGSPVTTPTGTATGPVRSRTTERGWESEMAIPLRTLRYQPGRDPHLGPERDAQHPPEERAGVSSRRSRAATTSTGSRWRRRSSGSTCRAAAT